MTYRIRQTEMTEFRVEYDERYGLWPFRFTRWHLLGIERSETDALNLLAKNVDFKPITTYYNRHGEKYLEPVAW